MSTTSRSYFIHWIRFRSGNAIWTRKRKNLSSVGLANSPTDRAIRIIVHFPEAEAQTKAARELKEAFRRYFSDHAGATQREIKELFRIGRRSLGIGVTILIICLLSAHFVGGYLIDTPFRRLVEESFLILGWVANWRPLEIFLYDWLPLARRRDLYRRLAAATVELKSYAAPKPSEP